MPIYVYECRKCGDKFELFRSMNDKDEEVACPKCAEKGPKRTISAVCGGSGSYGSSRGNLRFPT